jgi:hypothetical protein
VKLYELGRPSKFQRVATPFSKKLVMATPRNRVGWIGLTAIPLLVAITLVAIFLVGCDSAPDTDEASTYPQGAKYKVETGSIRDRDQVEIRGDAPLTYVDVHLVDGIGKTKIWLVEGEWPQRVVVRVHSGMLEKFGLLTSDEKESKGGFNHRLVPGAGEWEHHWHGEAEVEVRVEEKDALGAAEYFEIVVPAEMLDENTEWISLRWIDAYRG